MSNTTNNFAKNPIDNTTVITGDMFVVPNPVSNGVVEVWCTSPVSDNWSDHGHPALENRMPSRMPVELFADKVEGDSITLVRDGVTIELVLAQQCHRYEGHGQFETVLAKVIADGEYYDERYNTAS